MSNTNLNSLVFTVVDCSETDNGDFHIKLQYKGEIQVKDDFGTTTQNTQLTFYRFIDQKVKVGTKGSIDFSKFNIEEREYEIEETGELVTLKDLKPKKA